MHYTECEFMHFWMANNLMKNFMIAAIFMSMSGVALAQAPNYPITANLLPPVEIITDKLDASAEKLLDIARILSPIRKKDALSFGESQLKFTELLERSEDCAKLIKEADLELKRTDRPIRNDAHFPVQTAMAAHWTQSLSSGNNPTDVDLQGNIAIDRANVASALSYLLRLKTSSLEVTEQVTRAEKHLAFARGFLAESIEKLEKLKNPHPAKTKERK